MDINYQATKTASKFHSDDSFVRLLMGPVGCGKSVANCIEVFRRAYEQEPGKDGIRRSRWGIVRNTYPELKSTTIKTWLTWFPESIFGKVRWDSPITHRICINNLDLEVIFLALDSEQDIGKLMSFEFTGIYVNELQYIHPKIFEKCQERVGRYDPKDGSNLTWTGVIADTNPPSTRHWIYKLFENNKPDIFSIYKFEPAMLKVDDAKDSKSEVSQNGSIYIVNPQADYIKNLKIQDLYYLRQIPGKDDEEIKVSILGDYGISVSGRPVHPEYKDRLHYAGRELKADPELEIGLGWDFGLTPACVIVQFTAIGQLLVLDELYSDDMSLQDFAENIVIPHLDRDYSFWRKNYISRHDPAGQGESQINKQTCQDALRNLGINSFPAASSNAPMPRRNGLKYHLRRLTCGEPGFYLSSRAQLIREGLMGHYQYARIQINEGIETRYHEKPLKNMHSHSCEALEYIAMKYSKQENENASNDHRSAVLNKMAASFYHSQKLRGQR